MPTPRPTATPAPVELYDVTVRWDDEEIDLRGIKIEDAGAEVSEALPRSAARSPCRYDRLRAHR